MSVVNAKGWLRNALKKEKVKDLHALAECIAKTTVEKKTLCFSGDWKSEIDFVLSRIERYIECISKDMQAIAKDIHRFIYDPSVNKLVFDTTTLISVDNMEKPLIEGDVIRVRHSQAAILAECLFLNSSTKALGLTVGKDANDESVLSSSDLLGQGAWRVCYAPREVLACVRLSEISCGNQTIKYADVLPGGYVFVEVSCQKEDWHVAGGINIGPRCDLYFERESIKLAIRPFVEPLIPEEVDVLQRALRTATWLYEEQISKPEHDRKITYSVLPNGAITFTVSAF